MIISKKVKVYLVYGDPYCEDEETCSCHLTAKTLQGVYLNRKDAEERVKNFPGYTIEEEEVL